MKQKKILATALVASTIAGIGIVPAQNAEAASLNSFVSNALAIANDDSHGYSMVRRWGPDYDCSSFVITCLKQAGFETGGATYSGNMVSNLTAHGWSYIPSSKINLSSASSLKSGDILMASGHTEIYIGNGKRVGAHSNYDGKTGDSSGREINVMSYSRGNWYGILRYTGSGNSASAVTTTPATTAASTAKAGVYIVNANLNLRSGNSSGTSILTTIPKGTSVSVTQTSNGWGKTTYGGKTGWIYLSYTTKTGNKQAASTATAKTAEAKKAAAVKGIVYKTTANVNLRGGGGTGHSILTSVPKGTSVTVTQTTNGWGKITYGGKTGWICLDYAAKTSTPKTTATTTSATKKTSTAKVSGTVYKTNGSMYLRSGNNKTSPIIGLVPNGTKVTATKVSDGWGKITYGGKTGWMSLKYSTKTGTVKAAKDTSAATKKTTTASTKKSTPATAKKTASAASATVSEKTSKTTSYIYRTEANLYLRSGNSKSHNAISVVPYGATVTVKEIKDNWGKVSYGGKTGWISLKYADKKGANVVTTITSVVKNASSSTTKSVTYSYTTTANLNLRKSYSTASARILTMPNGTKLTVTEIKNNWGKVNYKGNVGWMSLQYAICTGSQTTVKNIIGAPSTAATASAKTTAKTAAAKTTAAKTTTVKASSKTAKASSAKASSTTAKTTTVKASSTTAKKSAANTQTTSVKTASKKAAMASVTDPNNIEEVATVPAESEVKLSVVETAEEAAKEVQVEATPEAAAEVEAEVVEDVVEETVEEAEAEVVEETVEEAEAEVAEETVEEAEAEVTEETVEEAEAEEESAGFTVGNYAAQKEIKVYADAYEGAEVRASFGAGTVLEVTESSEGWGKVSIDGQTCWIRLADFEITSEAVTSDLSLMSEAEQEKPQEDIEAEQTEDQEDIDAEEAEDTESEDAEEDGGSEMEETAEMDQDE